MLLNTERMARIAVAARKRIASQAARGMRTRVAKALRQNKPVAAEPDPDRRRRRVEAVTDCDPSIAARLIAGESPGKLLVGDGLMGADD